MKVRRGLGTALFGAGLVVMSCSADRGSVPVDASAGAIVSTSGAATRIADLRTRFLLPVPVATRFEVDAATHMRAVLPSEALVGVSRAARVALPLRANGEVELEDQTSRVSVRFTLLHVKDAPVEVAGGLALYRGALDGADVVHRVHAEGTEDFVMFENRPALEELSYSVDVSRVPGLRLVSNTLEFLDEIGTPLLRVAPPYVVDARGQHHEAKLAVSGCAYDASPAGPWGRKVKKPGAERCSLRVTWAGDIAYPAMVDPAWGATGSMAVARSGHTASVLPSGKVLVAGGGGSGAVVLASAELFDPAGNGGSGTFAATGSMATARSGHSASVLASGAVLVVGGRDGAMVRSSAELFDAAGNAGGGTFVTAGSMTTGRTIHAASVLLSGKVLVTGGTDGAVILTSAELFDPAGNAGAGTFSGTGSMAAARQAHTASVLPSGKVLVAGGGDATVSVSSAELYDPDGNAGAGAFSGTGSMTGTRAGHTASVLPSGRVLVAGGVGGAAKTSLSSAELFDPAGNGGAGGFAATAAMTSVRFGHTASVLPSGNVLVVGRLAGGATDGATAELFEPAGNGGAGTFAATCSMASARFGHTTSVLPSGKVLIAGGVTSSFVPYASAELFSFTASGACAAAGACTLASDCRSGFCADGVCCDAACSGSCARCDLPGKVGTCTVAPTGNAGANPACALGYACDGASATCPTSCASDRPCAADYYCAASGVCEPRRAGAAACNIVADCKYPGCRVCASGFCTDGVCCDKSCGGQCEQCDSAGACVGVAGKPRGDRFACPRGTSCGAKTRLCEGMPAPPSGAGNPLTPGADPPPAERDGGDGGDSSGGCSVVTSMRAHSARDRGALSLALLALLAAVRRHRRGAAILAAAQSVTALPVAEAPHAWMTMATGRRAPSETPPATICVPRTEPSCRRPHLRRRGQRDVVAPRCLD